LRYLSSLQTQALSFQRLDFSRNSVAREIFDTAPAGVVPRTARILDGNLFEAVNINLRQHVGHKIVYTAINPDTGKSEKHHGILVNSGISDRQLEAIPERVRDQQTLLRLLLESEKPVTTRPDGDAYHKDTPLAFFPAGDRGSAVVISVPAEKSKGDVRLLFWSGQSFDEPSLLPEGSFKAAEARYTGSDQINIQDLKRWLKKAQEIQWDYKNIVKNKGVLNRLK
jgi:hypothetical protein